MTSDEAIAATLFLSCNPYHIDRLAAFGAASESCLPATDPGEVGNFIPSPGVSATDVLAAVERLEGRSRAVWGALMWGWE
jgi:hypothetical protein